MTPADVTTNLRLTGLVRRYHTWPVIREQTTAEHSWQVMRTYLELFGEPLYKEVYTFILLHDSGEIATGDLPYPTKRLDPDLKAKMDAAEARALEKMGLKLPFIQEPEMLKFRIAHALEMWEYCTEERVRGNRFAEALIDRLLENIAQLAGEEHLQTVLDFINRKRWLYG